MRSRRAPAKSRTSLAAMYARAVVWLLRLLVIVIVAQFSGVAHYAAEAVEALEGVSLHEGKPSCPYEDKGDECPPGCPDCHCAHFACAVPPAFPQVEGLLFGGVELSIPHESRGPPSRELGSVYRPPRSLLRPTLA